MRAVFLSIGSNIQPETNIPASLELLKKKFPTAQFSTVYETEPVGPAGSEKFWNLVAKIETDLDTKNLSQALRELETQLGRTRSTTNRFAPRTLDLDILPQSDYHKFAFIIVPLAEIAPDERDPNTGKTFRDLARPFADEAKRFRKVNCQKSST